MSHVLPDLLRPGLNVVFCGTAAGSASAKAGAYYAGRGNRFWKTLYETGLTPRLLTPAEFKDLPEFGIGLTDLAKFTSGADSDLAQGDFDPDGFAERIGTFAPRILAFNGKKAAQVCRPGEQLGYGLQSWSIGGTEVHVLPSTSGAANGSWNVKFWEELAERVRAESGSGSAPEHFEPPHPLPPLRGDEPFAGLDATVVDFWRWAFPDLRVNTTRGALAEFLVASAVGAAGNPKVEWANFDVESPEGIRIEVKASAYWQSWPQRTKSVIKFSGLTARRWQEDGTYTTEREIRADVFVFALQCCEVRDEYEPLDISQWEFRVLPAAVVRDLGKRSLSLKTIERAGASSVTFSQLADAIRQAHRRETAEA